MIKRVLYILLFLPFAGNSQNLNLITHRQAIEHALKNNFDISIANNNSKIATNENNLGNAGFLPKIDLNANTSLANNNTKQEFSNGLVVDKKNVASNLINTGIQLNWTIFDGMKMFVSRSKLNLLEKESDLDLKIQIENTIEEVTLSYYQIVRQNQLIKGLQTAQKVSEERIKLAKKKLEIGMGSQVELLQAQIDFNAQASNLLNQENELKTLQTNLLLLIKPESTSDFSVDSIFYFENISNIDDLNKKLMEKNFSLLKSEKKIEITEQNIKEIRTKNLPKLSLQSNYLFGKTQNAAGFSLLNQNLGYNLGLGLSWNIFNGFTDKFQIQNGLLTYQNQKLLFEKNKSSKKAELNLLFEKHLLNKKALELEEQNMKLAEQALEISKERLKLKLGNYLETKESQNSYELSLTRLVNARYNMKKSEIQLKKICGELIE